MTTPALSVVGLSVHLPWSGQRIISEISFEAHAGKITSILGPSGCGKTTLLRAIAGLIDGVSGHSRVDGQSVDRVPTERRRVCLVSHRGGLFPQMNVVQNVEFPYRAAGLTASPARKEAISLLRHLHLVHLAEHSARALSRGEHQQVVLARAIASRPKVLLLDEPFSGLDPALHRNLRDSIRSLMNEYDTAVVHVTHDQKEALASSDSILLMNEGRVVQFGNPKEIYNEPVNAFAAGFMELTNVLHGHADSVGTIRIGQLALSHSGVAPGPISVAVRPSDWLIRPSNAEGLYAIVRTKRYVGSFTEYEMSTAAGVVIVHDYLRCGLELGAPLVLSVAVDQVALLQ